MKVYYTNGYLGIKLDLQKDVLHVAKLAKEIPNVHFKITLLSLPDGSSKKMLKQLEATGRLRAHPGRFVICRGDD